MPVVGRAAAVWLDWRNRWSKTLGDDPTIKIKFHTAKDRRRAILLFAAHGLPYIFSFALVVPPSRVMCGKGANT